MLRCRFLSLTLTLLVLASVPSFAGGDDWLPISKEDLAMKDFAPFPGAHAVILYRKVDRNDKEGWEKQYYRIKILDEQGKDSANIETETLRSDFKFTNLEARTIKPDGTIVPFQGKPVDKLVAKYKQLKLYAKTFTLPDVQAGSIIEYRYKTTWDTAYLHDTYWNVQEWLPTRDLDLSLRYDIGGPFGVSWQTFFLKEQPVDNKGVVSLTVHNIPGLEKEEYMPPELELRARVDFTYFEGRMKKVDEYWNDSAKDWYKGAEDFMNKKKATQAEIATLVQASDSPDAKLQKIYDRVQKLRNLTYEAEKSEKEQEREKLKDNNNVEDVLKHGYAWHNQLTRTFTALARAAGFEATIVRVSERDQYFPHKEIQRFDRFDTELAMIKMDGKERFFDPGTPFCPFGLLSWEDTGTLGMMLNKDGVSWKSTPVPQPTESMRKRIADLQLDHDGALAGNITVSFEGQDALYRRLKERENDDAQRKKDMEDMFKSWLPAGTNVELSKVDDWKATTDKFVVTAKVNIPNFAAATGKRMLVPASVFPGDANPFNHARRVYPIYLRYPYQEADEITIKVPDGMAIENLPNSRQTPSPLGDLALTAEKQDKSYKITRQVALKGYYFPTQYYEYVRDFMGKAKAMGEEQAVLHASSK